MAHPRIDPTRIRTRPLAQRNSLLRLDEINLDPDAQPPQVGRLRAAIAELADRVIRARQAGAPVVLVYGAHLVKNGCVPLVNRLIRDGWITHLATQGAGVIHDWEFAFSAVSSESVRENTPRGTFGTWTETGWMINFAAAAGPVYDRGLGEALGWLVEHDGWPFEQSPVELGRLLAEQLKDAPEHPLTAARAEMLQMLERAALLAEGATAPRLSHCCRDQSIIAAAYFRRVPLCVMPGIGYDIYSCHPLFMPAAIGRASGIDFHQFCHAIEQLSGGVYLSIGSAIMSPQVFEKALSIANNLRIGRGEPPVSHHHVAVVDIQKGDDWDWNQGEPPPDHPAYYLRFCKSFHRLAGSMQYLCGDNRVVLANLVWQLRHAR
jgi:hypothetical protein